MKLKYTTFELILEMIGFIFIVGTFAYLFVMLESMPQEIATHFDASGIADQWGDKSEIFKLPLMGLVIYTFATVLSFFPKRWNIGVDPASKNAEKAFRYTKDMIILMKAEIAVGFAYVGFAYANQQPMSKYFLPAAIIIVFGTIVYYMIKTSRAKREGMIDDGRPPKGLLR